MLRSFLLTLILLGTGCMPGGGPSPNAVFVIPAEKYPISRVLQPLDTLRPALGDRIDKKSDFPYYEFAYWYPHEGSDFYGVAVVQWPEDLQGQDVEEMKGRYFVEVYAKDDACPLCSLVKASLAKHKVSFFSACEHPKTRTAFENIRCGT